MKNKSQIIPFLLVLMITSVFSANQNKKTNNTLKPKGLELKIMPIRLPIATDLSKIKYYDFDKDGDIDALEYSVKGIHTLWIDDDDDMKNGDMEGDMDNDCLCIDKDNDGVFAGPWDFCVDFRDTNNDGIADIETVIENGDPTIRGQWDWNSNLVWFFNDKKDNKFAYIDWDKILHRGWEHNAHCNFLTDYSGQTMFTKMSVSSFRINDLRYSWENPFIFYDEAGKGFSNMSIRFVEDPIFRNKPSHIEGPKEDKCFDNLDKNIDVVFKGKIDAAYISLDIDKDAGPTKEFNFDMTLMFKGKGYNYSNDKYPLGGPDGLKDADKFLYDARWRHLKELIFPPRDSAWSIIFNKSKWDKCWFTFDEDDDCGRWERVELYDPKDLFKVGRDNGGLDNNPQADAAGDRGEWDQDNSGQGKLYIGKFDGKFHLYGAEWGAWRIDQNAQSFQGYGGLYENTILGNRIQEIPVKFPTIKYTDTDNNGFSDLIEFDMDGDRVFETKLSYKSLNISDNCELINTGEHNFKSLNLVYSKMVEKSWNTAMDAMNLSISNRINVSWYSLFMNPKTISQKYNNAFWINFYIYKDLKAWAKTHKKDSLSIELDKAYLLGDWTGIKLN